MESPGWLEAILAGIIAILVIFWFRGGIKATMEQSRNAPKDWKGAIIPLAGVVLFVILLIMMVR
ncbi:MAG: hypothetical protein R3F53_15365 [Gammaproteobacteria bacterium]|nr:hypothetical protein [Candidatus Competibacteraceae bacterium]